MPLKDFERFKKSITMNQIKPREESSGTGAKKLSGLFKSIDDKNVKSVQSCSVISNPMKI